MDILNIELDKLRPYERNPKTHGKHQVERIAESIRRYGMVQPLVIDEANRIIIGHGRYEALRSLGAETAPCVRAENLTVKRIRELRIADNKLNEYSEWNDFLAQEILGLDMSWLQLEQDAPLCPDPDVKDLRPFERSVFLVFVPYDKTIGMCEFLDREGFEYAKTQK